MGHARTTRVTPSRFFPPPESAGRDGLLAVGGSLSAEWLIDAYRHGIFPWPTNDVLAWWSPDPRAVVEFGNLHISRRLARTMRSDRFSVTCNQDFSGVIHGCATSQTRQRATWLTRPLRAAYERLHRMGHAHSVEVRIDDRLVGGTYGVGIGAMFAAESMFYLERDASKVALARLVGHLVARGYEILDIQQLTPHTARMGASEIPREHYLTRLRSALDKRVTFGSTLEG